MTNRQMNQYDMFLRVQKVLQNYQPVWAGNIRFSANFQELSAILLQVNTLQVKQASGSIAITQHKEALKLRLMEQAIRIVKGAGSYAADVQDLALAAHIDYSRSGLAKMRETELVTTCLHIAGLVQPLLTTLSDYGITPALLDNFTQDCVAFRNIQPETQMAISHNKTITSDMAELFPAAAKLLKEHIDGKMEQYTEAIPVFTRLISAPAILLTGAKA